MPRTRDRPEPVGDGALRRRVTMKDVAAEAGVDVSTVSKVLAAEGRITVRPDTRERIEAAVARLGYRPHAVARSLRLQRTNMIGLLLPDFTNPLYSSIVRGAALASEEHQYALMVAGVTEVDEVDAYRRLVHEQRIDGVLVALGTTNDSLLEQIRDDGIPHVFVNRPVAGSGRNVVLDEPAGIGLVVEALAERGHQRLGIIDAATTLPTSARRARAFNGACRRLGLPKPVRAVGVYHPGEGYEAMRELLAAHPDVTGVFVSNAYAALGAYAAAADGGRAIGRDLALITYEESTICDALRPRLAAVQMPYRELGRVAVEALHAQIDGQAPADVVVRAPAVLSERESLSRR